MMLDFRPEVEIWMFGACAMKNTQYNPYLWPNYQNFCIMKEIEVQEHDGDIGFCTGSGNVAISCMRNASGHNYRNSLFIVAMAMGQIHVPQNVFLVVDILFLLVSFVEILLM